jgi:hypothetical protein
VSGAARPHLKFETVLLDAAIALFCAAEPHIFIKTSNANEISTENVAAADLSSASQIEQVSVGRERPLYNCKKCLGLERVFCCLAKSRTDTLIKK